MKFSAKEIQLRKVLAIAALGRAGFCGVASCATAAPDGDAAGGRGVGGGQVFVSADPGVAPSGLLRCSVTL